MADPATQQKHDTPPGNLSGTFNTYASAETRQKLGWIADKAAEWSGRDVVLVSKNDLLEYSTAQNMTIPGGPLLGTLQAVLPPSQQNTVSYWSAMVGNDRREQMKEAVLSQSPFAANLSIPTPNNPGICIIALPDLDDTKEFLTNAFSGGSADAKRMPGDNEDWMAVVVAHEATHCKMHAAPFPSATIPGETPSLKSIFQKMHDHTLKQEIQADQRGFSLYRDAVQDGQSLDPAVLGAFKSLRAIDSLQTGGSLLLGSNGNDHTTNLLLQTGHHDHDGHNHLDPTNPKDITAITTAQNETAIMAQMAIGMTFGRAYVNSQPEQKLLLSHEGVLSFAADPTKDSPSVQLRDFDTNPQRASMLSGYALVQEKPEMLYAATRVLQERGAFGQGTLQEAYAKQYIDAIEATTKQPNDPGREALVTFFHQSLEESQGGAKTMAAAVRHNIALANAPETPTPDAGTLAQNDMTEKRPSSQGTAPAGPGG